MTFNFPDFSCPKIALLHLSASVRALGVFHATFALSLHDRDILSHSLILSSLADRILDKTS
jgi:hypothetical protein